jgi:SAM-dependent methyltransferase
MVSIPIEMKLSCPQCGHGFSAHNEIDDATIRKLGALLEAEQLKARVGQNWKDSGEEHQRREYESYEAYLAHQKGKLGTIGWIDQYDVDYRKQLSARLQPVAGHLKGRSVICLGARIGTEVKAFLDHGAFAVGIDLNPGDENRYVLHGDFNHLQFADSSVDVAFTNVFDHVFEIESFVAEILRVLKPGGKMIADIQRGSDEGFPFKFWESFTWKSIDALLGTLEGLGLKAVSRSDISYPYPGQHVIFEPTDS